MFSVRCNFLVMNPYPSLSQGSKGRYSAGMGRLQKWVQIIFLREDFKFFTISSSPPPCPSSLFMQLPDLLPGANNLPSPTKI